MILVRIICKTHTNKHDLLLPSLSFLSFFLFFILILAMVEFSSTRSIMSSFSTTSHKCSPLDKFVILSPLYNNFHHCSCMRGKGAQTILSMFTNSCLLFAYVSSLTSFIAQFTLSGQSPIKGTPTLKFVFY